MATINVVIDEKSLKASLLVFEIKLKEHFYGFHVVLFEYFPEHLLGYADLSVCIFLRSFLCMLEVELVLFELLLKESEVFLIECGFLFGG
jgi:hypothetical protein